MRRGILILLAAVLVCGAAIGAATGPAEKVASGGGTFQKEYTSISAVPSAWIIYSEDAAAFTVQRYFGGSAETHAITIPASTSITLSTPTPADSSGTLIVKMAVTSNTDDVVFIPVFN